MILNIWAKQDKRLFDITKTGAIFVLSGFDPY